MPRTAASASGDASSPIGVFFVVPAHRSAGACDPAGGGLSLSRGRFGAMGGGDDVRRIDGRAGAERETTSEWWRARPVRGNEKVRSTVGASAAGR